MPTILARSLSRRAKWNWLWIAAFALAAPGPARTAQPPVASPLPADLALVTGDTMLFARMVFPQPISAEGTTPADKVETPKELLQGASPPRYLSVGLQAADALQKRFLALLPESWKSLAAAPPFRALAIWIETGATSRLTIELDFADAQQAGAAAKVVGQVPAKLSQFLTPLAEQFNGDPATRNLGKLVAALASGIKAAGATQSGSVVTLTAVFPEDLETLLDSGSQELAILLVRRGPTQ